MTNSTTNVNNVLESLILVSLSEIHGISGRKKLTRSDFGVGVDLPPDVIVSLGSKKIIDPQLLNPFNQYKSRAHALCSAVGVRFLGGYAVPADRVNDLISELNDVKTEFYIYKNTFLQSNFTRWIDNCDEKYRDIIRDGAKLDIKYMDEQIQFGFTAIHITPYGNSVIQDGIAAQVKSLSDEVFEDVSRMIEKFLGNLNKEAFTQHTIKPLRRTAEKLASLGFISDSVNNLSVYMNEVLSDVPVSGKVTGRKYSDILSLLNNLRDPERAQSFIDLLNKDSTANPADDNSFIDLSGTSVTAPDPVVPAHQNEPVVTPVPSPAPVAVDKNLVDTSSYVPDDFYADSVSVVEEFATPVVAPVVAPEKSVVVQPSESVSRADDGFATDLPFGDEVTVETVLETSPAPVASASAAVDVPVVSAPAVETPAPVAPAAVVSDAPAAVEGFVDVVVVDADLEASINPVAHAPDVNLTVEDDGIFLF
ncbi:DUF3150 domain-containing protein (plasmid) [Providencia huaxiensis]|uniref:DUF3150 domain-containing protein n=4 Tax=Enterobacterales TaxID=91347 RepID=A0AA42FKJ5_9GAMM|nr:MULTISPECIES: DUF3150 domain-containing protein [Enterobacterales]ELB1214837.1 DUF3150 domain-containing protein [Proteus mirabilis]SPY66611.1 Protein of uncharacterised function (DUF3150) [Providencia stuartii]HAZ7965701.1 DUF3150 domain-containing protein [Escherichia coli]ELR5094278.1 DUF3150 domain-containing protein [Providencia rettgeri]ELR5280602.1 DUF3150 domain-containing protein [Providencia rettgeri]